MDIFPRSSRSGIPATTPSRIARVGLRNESISLCLPNSRALLPAGRQSAEIGPMRLATALAAHSCVPWTLYSGSVALWLGRGNGVEGRVKSCGGQRARCKSAFLLDLRFAVGPHFFRSLPPPRKKRKTRKPTRTPHPDACTQMHLLW